MQVHSKGSISALDGKLTVELEFQPDSEEEQILIAQFLAEKPVIQVGDMRASVSFEHANVHVAFAQSLAEHNAKKGENALAIPLEAYKALNQDIAAHMTGVGAVPMFGLDGTATAVSHEGASESSTAELTSTPEATD